MTTTAVHTIRSCIERDLNDEPQSVIRVDEVRTLHADLSQYVLTDQLAQQYANVFAPIVASAKPASAGATDVGIWISGFFGSGKSLFAKLAGHALADTPIGDQSARALFERHLRRGRPGDDQLAALLQEARSYRLRAVVVPFDITSHGTAAGERNVGLIFLSTLYRALGLSPLIPIAQAEILLRQAGRYDQFLQLYRTRGDQVAWEQDRDQAICLPIFAECLAELLPQRYPDAQSALKSLEAGLGYTESYLDIESVVNELLKWLDSQRSPGDPNAPRLIFVADEVGAWAGSSRDRIEQLRAFVTDLGRLGQGRIWLIATSQEKLSEVVAEQANLGANARLMERLEARFNVNVHLTSSEVSTVIADRVLFKRPTARDALLALWQRRQQTLLDIASPSGLDMGGNYPRPDAEPFIADYPFLPYQLPAAADLFGRMRGVKISAGARSMLRVAFDATRAMADKSLGRVVSWDQIFDSANSGNEFADEHYLGSLGLDYLRQADRDLTGTPITPSRVLKVLWLMQHNPNVPRNSANLARLLVDHLDADVLALETDVRATLEALERKSFVRRDPATEQWKHLSQEEVTIEQMLARIAHDEIKASAVRKEIGQLYEQRVTHTFTGRITLGDNAPTPFSYALTFEGTTLKGAGQPVTLRVHLPGRGTAAALAAEHATNLDAPVVSWLLDDAAHLEERLRRALAIEALRADDQYTRAATDRTREQLPALDEEAKHLRAAADAAVGQALQAGTLYYAGNTIPLDESGGTASAHAEIERALRERIASVYYSFADADRKFRPDNIDRLFTAPPAERAALDPALSIFSPDGHVRANHALVEPILGYLKTTNRTSGQDVADQFGRVPCGWPADLLRYVAAALFVDGKVAAADKSGVRYDDYRTPAARALFGTAAFKSTRLDVEEDALTPEEVTAARALLMDLGKPSQDGTEVALKEAALQLCSDLNVRCGVLERAAAVSFPLPDGYITIPGLAREIQEAGSRAKVVRALLLHAAALRQADADLKRLRRLDEQFGFAQFQRTQQLMAASADAGLIAPDAPDRTTPDDATSAHGRSASEAREQLAHLIAERRVLDDWDGAFKHNRIKLFDAFRDTYVPLRREVTRQITAARQTILAMSEFTQLSQPNQTDIRRAFLGQGCPLQELPDVKLQGDDDLLRANEAFSLAHLRTLQGTVEEQARRARGRVLLLVSEEQRARGERERTATWDPAQAFAGQRFTTVAEVEAAFTQELERLKRLIAEGKEIQVL